MILEQLISAYLDGDLTIEQDRDLRERMRTDPAAREAFDSAVLIHIAMRCEDATVPPPERRAAIFDAVDAIASENASIAMRPAVRPRRSLRMAATAIVALITLWLPVSDGDLRFGRPEAADLLALNMASESEAMAPMPGNEVVLPVPSTPTSDDRLPHVSEYQERADADGLAATDGPSEGSTEPAFGEGRRPELPLGTLFQEAVQPSGMALSTSAPSRSSASNASTEIIPWHDDEPLSVTVATSYAAGMGSTVASAQNVEQVSASLAYGLSDADAVGLEFGSTSYSIQQTSSMLTTSEPVSSSVRTSVNDGGSAGKLASPEEEQTRYGSISQDRTAQVRSMWGSAFYERRLLDLESVAVFGRAGAGVSQEGVLGFGRLTGQWTVGGGVALVVGAEARTMPFQTGAGNRVSSQISYGAIVTAITGLQVRF